MTIFAIIGSNISTFYLNKIIDIFEKDDIKCILDLYHKSLLGGHLGGEKMFKTISKFYKWNNMLQDIKDYVKQCAICEKTKVTRNTKMPMQISKLSLILLVPSLLRVPMAIDIFLQRFVI